VLLGTLFVISGGIYVRGSLSGTPLVNTAILALGAVPGERDRHDRRLDGADPALLRANVSRERTQHIVVFFIFVVSNCGGLLTPLGDPPLFLGFLKRRAVRVDASALEGVALVNGASCWSSSTSGTQIVLDREELERPGSQLEEVLKHEPLGIVRAR
jgi:hypothetical protein